MCVTNFFGITISFGIKIVFGGISAGGHSSMGLEMKFGPLKLSSFGGAGPQGSATHSFGLETPS